MNTQHRHAATEFMRWSLVFVWLLTAVVSVTEYAGTSRDLLTQAGITTPLHVQAIVFGGAGLDLLLGLLMAWHPRAWVYVTALISTLVMTLIASILSPEWWLHPLGPLSKNAPIVAILLALIAHTRR